MPFRVETTSLQDVLLLQPQIFTDDRGFFQETWNRHTFREAGLFADFVQDNFSRSRPGVLRGLHYQIRHPQGKLVSVTRGRVLDVAVDLRRFSPTFGKHLAVELSENNHAMLWIPPGFAHGFCVLGEETVDMHYKCTDFYDPEGERTIFWDDSDLNIQWPVHYGEALVSEKDRRGTTFREAEVFNAPLS